MEQLHTAFMKAHARGMAALEKRDFGALGQAIREERDIIFEHTAIVMEVRARITRVIDERKTPLK